MPLKYCKASGSLVIGAVIILLRLTALVLRGTSVLWTGAGASLKEEGRSTHKKRFIYPFKRATAEVGKETRRRSDAKRHWFSGYAAANLILTDWTNKGGLGSPQRLLVTFGRPKVTAGYGGAQPPLKSTGVLGRSPHKKRGASQRSSGHIFRTAFSCCWFSSPSRWLTAIFRIIFFTVTSRPVPSR